jgi:acetoin utilization deacetylase AcuC-like enzyme
MHGDNNYPWRGEGGSRTESDLDIELPDATTDGEYVQLLQGGLEEVEERWAGVGGSGPLQRKALCFYQAGVDPLSEDRLGRLGLSRQALRDRNRMVFEFCAKHELPLVVTMGGGYSRPIAHSAEAHTDVFAQAMSHYHRRQQ